MSNITTMSILRSLYQTLCAFLQIKDRKNIEQKFPSVARVMPLGWNLRVLGGSKTLAWGFAMAPHRLRILVLHYKTRHVDFKKCQFGSRSGSTPCHT